MRRRILLFGSWVSNPPRQKKKDLHPKPHTDIFLTLPASLPSYCGQGTDYCTSPGCQLSYGPACEGNQPPLNAPPSTASIPRPALGSVPYGAVPGIYSCTTPGTVALTYDDGPSAYTADLLDTLAAHGAHATFFVVGNNGVRGQISDPAMPWGGVVARMVAEGHQVASHTWTHENSSVLTADEMQSQLVYNEMALGAVLPGARFPTYFRPPYSICSAVCEEVVARLGYHVVYFDLDTADYLNDDAGLIQNSKYMWDAALEGSDPGTDSFLEVGHDIHYQTVYNLTDYMLTDLEAKGYRAVTVGECLGDPEENWYRQAS